MDGGAALALFAVVGGTDPSTGGGADPSRSVECAACCSSSSGDGERVLEGVDSEWDGEEGGGCWRGDSSDMVKFSFAFGGPPEKKSSDA